MTPTDNDSGDDKRSNAYLEQRVTELEELASDLYDRVERLEDESSPTTESNRSVENDAEPDYSELEFVDRFDQDVLTTLDEETVYKHNTIKRKYRRHTRISDPSTARNRAKTLIENTDLFEPYNGRVRFLGVGK